MYKGNDTNYGVSLVFHIQAPAFVKMILILSQAFTIRAKVSSILVFLITQLQIFAILANTAIIALETDSEGLQTFFKSFHNVFCLSGPYSDKDNLVWGHILLYLIYIYLLLMILYLFYLYIVISQKGNLFESLNCIWSSLIAIHPFILFYPIHYLLLSRLFGTALPFSNYGFVRIVEIIVVIVAVTVNFVFTALSLIFLNPKTKTKNAFSMKTSVNSVATLILKLVLSLCWFIDTSSHNAKIIMVLISILLNLLQDWFFFKTLPFYRVEILKVSTIFKAIFTSCAVSCIITKIVGSIRTIDQLKFATMLWIILSLCFIYFYSQILHKVLLNILLNPSQIQNRYHVIHYWYIHTYISARRIKPVEMTREIDKNYFYFHSKWNQTEIVKRIFNEKQSTIDDVAGYDSLIEQAIKDQNINSIIEMLKTALKRNKDSTLLKATLALYYLKYQKLYIRVDHSITEEISGSSSLLLKIPFYYLKLRLIRDMKEDSNTPSKTSNIDIHQHAQLKEIFEDMTAFMKKEISYRLNFWQEFKNSSPELSSLIKNANETYNYSQKLNKFWIYQDSFIQTGYTEPLFAFGLYFEHIHGLASVGEKLIRKYFDLKYKAKDDHFHHDHTGSFSDAIHLVVSGTSQHLGIILDCSKNVDKYLGIQKNDLLKSSINILMPLFFQKYHDKFLEETVNTENSKVLDKTRKVVVLHQDGYIMYYWIHITLTLLSDHGVCYRVILRPINDNKRRILVKGNGLIAHISENFAQDLKKSVPEITNKYVNQFCSKLEYVLHVFKIQAMMKSQQKLTSIHLENLEAQSNKEKTLQPIIDAYTKGDKLLFLTSQSHSSLETKSIDEILANDHLMLYHAEIQYYVHKDDILFQITMDTLDINDLSPAELKQIVLFQKIRHRASGIRQRSSHFSFDILKETDSKFALATTLIMNKNRTNEKRVLIQEPHESPKHGTDSLSSPKSAHKSSHKIYTISSEDSANENNPYQNSGSNHDVNPNLMSSSIKVKEDPHLIHQILESKTSPSPGTFEIDEKFKKNKFQLEPPSNVIDGDQESVSPEFQIPSQKDDPGFSTVGSPTILLKKVVFESNEDSLKPDIRELEKEVKVTHKRLKSENQETRSATRSSSQYNNRVHREIQLAINSKKHPKSTIVYYISYFVSLFAILFYLNWVSFDMIHVSEDVSTLRTVVDNMYFRNFWIKLANQETRLWTAVRGGVINIPGIVDMETEIATTAFAFNQINQFNQNLSVSIDALDKKIQNVLFERNVEIIVRDQDNSISIQTIDNTFTAVDKILSNGLKNIQKPIPDAPIENYVDPDSRFIFDNSMNDLLMVSENNIVIVEKYIANNIQSSRDTLIIPLVIVLFVLIVFVILSFRFVIALSREYSKFMDILFTVAPEEIMKIEMTLNIFQELLKDFSTDNEQIEALNSIKIQEKIRQTNAKNQNSKIEKKTLRPNVSFGKFQTRNNLLLVSIILVLFATSGLIVGYYELVLDRLSKMEKQQTTSSAALEYININSLISVELQTMIMDNATTTIRNLPVIQTLEADIQTLGKVADIQAKFENENGVLPPEQKIIFNNFPCSEAYSPLYFLSEDVTTGECQTLSNGGGSVGLSYIISTMAGKLDLFFSQFQTSTRTQDELETMYRQAIDTFIQYIDVSTTLFLISFNNVSDEFTDLKNKLDSDSRLFIGLAFVASFSIGAIGWRFIIKNLGQKQLKRKRILSVLPLGLILANPYLKKCAIKM